MEIVSPSPAAVAEALQRYYGFSPQKAASLAAAGPSDIRSPWSVPGMDALVERLILALQRREDVLVFSDFDADGVTGSAILYRTFSQYSDRIHRYTPRYREGYGLRPSQVERFARQGIRLIVTVDSGISSHQAVAHARQVGMEVLITDHHLPRQDLGPPDTLWINPEDHLLSGAQLTYLTAWALRQRLTGSAGHDPWGLALSAVGAQADWVPVDRPETRAWLALGHAAIHSPECPVGFQVLREVLGESYTPSEMRSLSGILNLGKRSHQVDPNAMVEALLAEEPDGRAREVWRFLAAERSRVNRAGELISARVLEELRGQAGVEGLLIYEVCIPDETLSEVEGPLTARIAETTGRPALVLRPDGDRINFSGRSRGNFSFESFLNDPEIRALVLDMGGHRQAIGGSVRAEDYRAFRAAVERWSQRQPPDEMLPAQRRPAEVLERLDAPLAYLLGRAIGPFGHHLRPLLYRTVLTVKGGWAFSDDSLVELNRPLEAGDWWVTFRFDEAGCDGRNVVVRPEEVERASSPLPASPSPPLPPNGGGGKNSPR